MPPAKLMFQQLKYFWLLSLTSLAPKLLTYSPYNPSKTSNSTSWEPTRFKFPEKASLKQAYEALWKSFICGNGNATSLLFNSVISLFAVIRSIAVASLIKLLLTLAA